MFQRGAALSVYAGNATVPIIVEAPKIFQLCEAAYVNSSRDVVIVDVEKLQIPEDTNTLDALDALPVICSDVEFEDSFRLIATPSTLPVVIRVRPAVPAKIFNVVDLVVAEIAVVVGVPVGDVFAE